MASLTFFFLVKSLVTRLQIKWEELSGRSQVGGASLIIRRSGPNTYIELGFGRSDTLCSNQGLDPIRYVAIRVWIQYVT